jgi:hypothetical protein
MSTRKNTNKIKSIREKSDKIINENKNIRDLEKRYLKGEKHKEISDIPEKEIKTEKDEEISNQNNANNTNNKVESKSNQLLKEKLSNIDINIKALNGINKSMEKQIKNIEKDILENQILITEPKRVIKINTKKTDKITNFEDKAKLKTIKGLNDSKNYLNSKLQQILLNEKYLKNEGNIENLNLSDKYVSLVDQNIYENKKIILENKKEQLITKISQIEEDLKTLSLSGDELSRRNRIKHYLQNFEKDKKIIESRAKKYYQESIERNKRIENDLNKKYDKMKKEYEEKKAEEKAKQIETLKKMKEKEKLILEKRTKENDEKYNKYKPYLSRKMKENIKDYLFIKKEETYKNEEQKLVEKENLRRKEKMKIDFNEINDFGKNVNEHIEKTKTEQNERKKKLLSEWKERKSSLPNYTLNLNRNKGETEEENTEKENEMQTLREKKEKMKIFAYDIKNNKQPEINEKLKNKRMLLIQSLENPKLAAKLSHKLLFQKYKRFSDEANKESNNNKNLNKVKKEIKLNNSLSPKRSKQKLFPLHPKSKTRIDYLTEMITKKEMKKSLSNEKDLNEDFNKEKWNKEINDKNGNVIENIDYIKQQAKLIDNKVKQKGQYLKLTGGVENNPEVGNEMSELIIDSIGAKLTILNVYK